MRRLVIALSILVLSSSCTLVYRNVRSAADPNYDRREYVALLARNHCPVASYNLGVNEQTCKLNPADARLVAKWAAEARQCMTTTTWQVRAGRTEHVRETYCR